MYPSMLLFALAGITSPTDGSEKAAWLTDYGEARKQSAAEKKPIAIFIAPGKESWAKVARGGSLGKENQGILAGRYVCLHLDSATDAGRQLAGRLGITTELGLVVTDQTGRFMAFQHEGDLASSHLTYYLNRYSDPERVVRTTETNPARETRSAYPPVAPAAPTYQPAISAPSGGRSC